MKSENTLREFMSGLIRVPKTRARVALLAILALTGTASALTINLTFDSDTVFMNAGLTPSDIVNMRAACNYAASQFTSNYSDPINVNIFVTAVPGTGTLGMSNTFIFSVPDYATLRNAIVADSTTPDDATALGPGGSVPMADPIGGSHLYVVSKAQRKALGLAGDDLSNDGTYTFGGGFTYTYDPANRAVPGAIDFIGVTMHEYSEIMGRIPSMGHNFFGQPDYMQFDLFHFTGTGVRGLNNGAGRSFSIDNGTDLLKAFNNAAMNGGDLQDWASGSNDAFNAFSSSSVENDLTPVDLRVMDVIGWNRVMGGGPPNDQCTGAIGLSAGVTRTDNTANATSTGDPTPTCVSDFGKGVWYTFTPTTNATVTISTCGSDFDTVLQIYTGSCAALTPVPNGCDDDNGPSCQGLQASVSFAGTAGTTYRILAGGYGSGTGNLHIVASVTAPPATDFNGDGHPDYALYKASTQQTAIWHLNNNYVHFGGAFGPTLPTGWQVVGVADFNLDDHPDYALYKASTQQTAIWHLNNNYVHFGGAFGPTLPTGWQVVGVADFNLDGHPDYALYKASTQQTAIWHLNNNYVHFGGSFGPTLPTGWQVVGVADFNLDGHPDYALYKASTRQTAIWHLNNNYVHFGGSFGPTLPTGWQVVGVADFNLDGHPDYALYKASTRQTAIWHLNNNYVHFGGAFGPSLPAGWSLAAP